jgi:hypothetical protein
MECLLDITTFIHECTPNCTQSSFSVKRSQTSLKIWAKIERIWGDFSGCMNFVRVEIGRIGKLRIPSASIATEEPKTRLRKVLSSD